MEVVNAIQAFNWHVKALGKVMCCLRAAELCEREVGDRVRVLKAESGRRKKRAPLQKVAAEVRSSISKIKNNVQEMLLSLELLGGLDLALTARDSKCKGVRFPPPGQLKMSTP